MSPSDDRLQPLFDSLARESVQANVVFKRRLIKTLMQTHHQPTLWEQIQQHLWQWAQLWMRQNPRMRWGLRGGALITLIVLWTIASVIPSQRTKLTVQQGSITANSPGLLAPWQVHRKPQLVNEQQTVSIKSGSSIVLPADSAAVVDLFNGSRVELSAGTQMTFTQMTPGSLWQAPTVQMQVETGSVHAYVTKLKSPQERFEVRMPSAQISVRGTIFRARVISESHTYIATDEGLVTVALFDPAQPDAMIEVPAGYEVHAIIGQPLHLQRQVAATVTAPTPQSTVEVQPTAPPLAHSTATLPAVGNPSSSVTLAPDTAATATPVLTPGAVGTPAPRHTLTPTITATPTLSPSAPLSETTHVPDNVDDEDDSDPSIPPVTRTHRADVAIRQHDTPDPTAAEGQLTYVLTVVNQGTAPAENVIVTDILPAEITLVTATDMISLSNPLVWDLGTLVPNARRVLFVETRVHSDVQRGFNNIVQVSSTTADTDLTNNRSVESTAVTQTTDLALTTVRIPRRIGAGETFTGVLTYKNFGPAHADAITLALYLPPEIHFGGTVTATPALDFIPGGSTVRPSTLLMGTTRPVGWAAATMPALSTGRVVFTLTATSDMTGPVSYALHIASITPDAHLHNNIHRGVLTVLPTADLEMTLSATPPTVISGDVLTYTLNFTNHGPWAAQNVRIEHRPAPGLQINMPTNWSMPRLPSGARGSLMFTATVTTTVRQPVMYTATLRSMTRDLYLSNNRSVISTPVHIADLTLHSYITPQRIAPHMPFTYTIVLTNTGDVTFPHTTLSLWGMLPEAIDYDVANAAGSSDQHLLSWHNNVAITPGAAITITLSPSATNLLPGNYSHTVTASVHFAGLVARASEATSITVALPSLAIEQQITYGVSGTTVSMITLTTYLTNTGPSPISILPMRAVYTHPNLYFLNAIPFPSSVISNGELIWHNTLALTRIIPVNAHHLVTTTFYLSPHKRLPTSLAYELQIYDAADIYQNRVANTLIMYHGSHQLYLPLVMRQN